MQPDARVTVEPGHNGFGSPCVTQSTRHVRSHGDLVANPERLQLLTVGEVCDELGIARSTFYEPKAKGKLPPLLQAAQRRPADRPQ